MDINFDKAESTQLLRYHDKCDKYDYLVAIGCGVVSGLVDVFLVGAPGDSVLGRWTDTQIDNCVKAFAKLTGWKPNGKEDISGAIQHLENKFSVNYDQATTKAVNGKVDKMGARNHHMKNLAHSPDIIGLFFSILNQFTSTSTFVSGSKLITIKTDTFELHGNNFISKLFCGIVNWIGHLMSDIAGSSTIRRNGNRGSGLVIPFYELFEFFDFGTVGNKHTFAELAEGVFMKGYDFRFGLTMAIPVVLSELLIKFIWALRRFFQYKKPLKFCIPTSKHDDLRVMLLIGNGILCLFDGADAIIRSGGSLVNFILRLNIIAWFRLITLVLKEICIRLGLSFGLEAHIEAFKRINAALSEYLAQLEKIDIELYQKEVSLCCELAENLKKSNDDETLNLILYNEFKRLGIDLPWKDYDSLDDFMNDKNAVLVFE